MIDFEAMPVKDLLQMKSEIENCIKFKEKTSVEFSEEYQNDKRRIKEKVLYLDKGLELTAHIDVSCKICSDWDSDGIPCIPSKDSCIGGMSDDIFDNFNASKSLNCLYRGEETKEFFKKIKETRAEIKAFCKKYKVKWRD
jgi:hypothetical protein